MIRKPSELQHFVWVGANVSTEVDACSVHVLQHICRPHLSIFVDVLVVIMNDNVAL